MAKKQDVTSFFKDTPFAFDAGAANDVLKTWGTFAERFSNIAVAAAGKSADITANSVKATLAGLRDVTKAQAEPADYAKVVGEFATAQAERAKADFEALGEVAKVAQKDATELFVTTGERVAEQSTKAANDAGEKVKAVAEKAVSAVQAA